MSDGLLLVDKPGGMTSAQVIRRLERAHRMKGVGHLGTLDPMATGLLPLCLGRATRLARFLSAEDKSYSGTIRLGLATDTLDVTGETLRETEVPDLTGADLEGLAARHVGPGEQLPPMYSAVKVGGKELYKHARAGRSVERRPRPMTIHALELHRLPDGPDHLGFSVHCSKGTYVRVLAEDIGASLGAAACLASLRRTTFGPYRLEEATGLEELLTLPADQLPVLEPLAALRSARRIPVGGDLAYAVATGRKGALARIDPPGTGTGIGALVAPNGQLLAVVEADSGRWQLRRVLMPEASDLYRPDARC